MKYEPKEWHPAVEEYCEAIFELAEDDLEVIQARIAERLKVSRAAVSGMMPKLEKEGVTHTSGRKISLTRDGQNLAEAVVRRHRLAERFLTDILGLSWADAHHEAGKWEHVISPKVEEALNEILGSPTTCPHGNPIPGSKYVKESTRNLAEVAEGTSFLVSRIPEELEFEPEILKFLEESNLVPGTRGMLLKTLPDGTRQLRIGNSHVDVDSFAAERILVAA